MGTTLELPAHHDAPADPGPQRHHHCVICAASRAGTPFTMGSRCRIVFDMHLHAESCREPRRDGDVTGTAQIGRCPHNAIEGDEAGNSDPHRRRVIPRLRTEFIHYRGKDCNEITSVRSRLPALGEHCACCIDENAEALGPSDVDADKTSVGAIAECGPSHRRLGSRCVGHMAK